MEIDIVGAQCHLTAPRNINHIFNCELLTFPHYCHRVLLIFLFSFFLSAPVRASESGEGWGKKRSAIGVYEQMKHLFYPFSLFLPLSLCVDRCKYLWHDTSPSKVVVILTEIYRKLTSPEAYIVSKLHHSVLVHVYSSLQCVHLIAWCHYTNALKDIVLKHTSELARALVSVMMSKLHVNTTLNTNNMTCDQIRGRKWSIWTKFYSAVQTVL